MVLMLCPVTAFADEHVYRVAGEPALCDSGWAATDDDNRMTYNGETGRYEKVYTGVRSESYMYKITVDGAWSDDFAEIKTVEVENDNATVTVWYVETTGEWGADVAYDTPAAPTASNPRSRASPSAKTMWRRLVGTNTSKNSAGGMVFITLRSFRQTHAISSYYF